ncbi:MAG TPA: sigma 54-interacting transcriptional regulator [Polyangia bacterium]|jgi:DNA-binding NtrC family response regulator|nr:sigma 54-interacting transcriptional regulator [Polyangia bacterium]
MGTKTNDSTTVREAAAARGARTATPVLLMGSFLPESARVVRLDRPVTVGRGRSSVDGGRGLDEEVIVRGDRTLSRPHLRIAPSSGGWTVADLGSTNGTFVDGRRLKKPARLAEGSIVQFGGQAGVFRRVPDDALAAIEAEAAAPLGPVATLSPALAATAYVLRRLARIDGAHLLLVGETGVGKEVYARAVHAASGRKGGLVAVNCAALPRELVESELFGYARGAHSTATRAKPGLVEMADGGTLLLDEIGEMDPRVQAKLFRFLQDGHVQALGATRARPVDVRVVAATSQVSASVRSDLVGRLGAEPIVIPPLRERPEDIGALVAHFGGPAFPGMDPPAFRALCLYAWPRNVRELGEVMKRALALAGGNPIRVDALPGDVRAVLETGPRISAPRRYRTAVTRLQLEQLMRDNHGNVSAVAKTLGRQWAVVQRWLRRHDLKADHFRG